MGSGSEELVSSEVSVVWVMEDGFLASMELLAGIFSLKGLINGSGILESVEEDSEVGETSISDSSDSVATGGISSEVGDSSGALVGFGIEIGSFSTNGKVLGRSSRFLGTEILGLIILLAVSRDNSPLTN